MTPSGGWGQLRLGTHNVRSLRDPGRARVAAAAWHRLHYDVVFVQETKQSFWTRGTAAAEMAGWEVFWACVLGDHPAAGVAIAVRRSVLRAAGGALELDEGSVVAAADGRLLHVRATWLGHSLHLASVYMPNDSVAQRAFIRDRLVPLAAEQRAAGRACLWAGDFNFVPDLLLDRWRPPGVVTSSAEALVAGAWATSLGAHLSDVFRARRPTARSYTRIQGGLLPSAARLDRLYVSVGLVPHVCHAAVARIPICVAGGGYLSDHRPVSLTLLPAVPVQPWPAPTRRVRTAFCKDETEGDSVREAVAVAVAAAPADDAALLRWWPRFKSRLAAWSHSANRRLRARSLDPGVAAAGAAVDALFQRVEAGDFAAVGDVAAALGRVRSGVLYAEEVERFRVRRSWLHTREYPTPGLTRRLAQRRPPAGIHALRGSSGRLVVRPPALAAVTIRHWAAVSRAPALGSAGHSARLGAQAAVLASLAASGGPHLPASLLAPLAATSVGAAEVVAALRHSRGGTSPGLDGLPVEVYRCCRVVLAPLLARLFSAVWRLGRLPPGFHDGVVTVLHKVGDKADPANYRPITLLNTDYRLFAKLLATRLGTALSGVIGRQQTAFLPARRIGDNVLGLQLLPHALAREGRTAFVAFCDFVKAYDTVDRSFLFSVMAVLGVAGPFLAVVRLLLSGTRARAVVNGALSAFQPFTAGVRQGCPLAPLLYLCVGEALHRWLASRDVGVQLGGRLWTAFQYADDTEVLLAGEQQAAAFVSAMDVFAAASGQRLHLGKTRVLRVGYPRRGSPPVTLGGLTVVREATALGFTWREGLAGPSAPWGQLLADVEAAFARIAALQLSPMGRGLASAAYGVSKLLYFAEFVDIPAATFSRLHSATRRLVLGGPAAAGCAPCASRIYLPASVSVCGSPGAGGFGALPWREHVLARLVVWFGKLARPRTPAEPPWIDLADALLGSLSPFSLAPLGSPGRFALLPSCLRRLLTAYECLPHPCSPPGSEPRWHLSVGRPSVLLWDLRVRDVSFLLLGCERARRTGFFSVAAAEAGGCVGDVELRLHDVWRLPWGNCHKSVLWALVYDAFSYRWFASGATVCVCGSQPGRRHFFWECAVARRVVAELQRHLPLVCSPLAPVHVWLGRVPLGVGRDLWAVVSLAALGAMDAARRFVVGGRLADPVRSYPLQVVASRAVARFWILLEDFRVLGVPAHFATADGHSPFLAFDPSAAAWSLCRLPLVP